MVCDTLCSLFTSSILENTSGPCELLLLRCDRPLSQECLLWENDFPPPLQTEFWITIFFAPGFLPSRTSISCRWQLLNQYIVSDNTTYPVYCLVEHYWPSISSQWTLLTQCHGECYSPSISSRQTILNQYIIPVNTNEPDWPSISSRWPLLNQYIVSENTTDPVYRLGEHYWPSISS